MSSRLAAAAIRLLMLSGCRHGEILTLRWEEVDLDARELRLRDAKTGPRVVPLSPQAVDVLAGLARAAQGRWVVPGQKPDTHLTTLNRTWDIVRARGAARGAPARPAPQLRLKRARARREPADDRETLGAQPDREHRAVHSPSAKRGAQSGRAGDR